MTTKEKKTKPKKEIVLHDPAWCRREAIRMNSTDEHLKRFQNHRNVQVVFNPMYRWPGEEIAPYGERAQWKYGLRKGYRWWYIGHANVGAGTRTLVFRNDGRTVVFNEAITSLEINLPDKILNWNDGIIRNMVRHVLLDFPDPAMPDWVVHYYTTPRLRFADTPEFRERFAEYSEGRMIHQREHLMFLADALEEAGFEDLQTLPIMRKATNTVDLSLIALCRSIGRSEVDYYYYSVRIRDFLILTKKEFISRALQQQQQQQETANANTAAVRFG